MLRDDEDGRSSHSETSFAVSTPPATRSVRRLLFGPSTRVLVGAATGVACGVWPIARQDVVAKVILTLFMNVLNLLSLPIIFLALCTTLCGTETIHELRWLGQRVITYTLATTIAAASIALLLFLWIQPAQHMHPHELQAPSALVPTGSTVSTYMDHLLALIPRHIFAPFMEGNVLAVLALAVVFGLALAHVPDRQLVHRVGAACLQALMTILRTACHGIALVVWAGVVLSFQDLRDGPAAAELLRYVACVVGANVIQGLVTLPLFLRAHDIAPFRAMRRFWPALNLAFFTKSSVATIPVAIERAEQHLGVHPKVARFTFPICTTINMNGCAAFILITVLFVSQSVGRTFTPWELVSWIGIATLAAVGNAGVPMGCYFLASAFLAAMDVPLTKMTLILPFYSFIDMLETALNVWSDGCVAMIVNRRYRALPDTIARKAA